MGGPSFQDYVTKKRPALGTRKGGEPHQNSFTEQVFEDAVKNKVMGKWRRASFVSDRRTVEELSCTAAPCRASGGLKQKYIHRA